MLPFSLPLIFADILGLTPCAFPRGGAACGDYATGDVASDTTDLCVEA